MKKFAGWLAAFAAVAVFVAVLAAQPPRGQRGPGGGGDNPPGGPGGPGGGPPRFEMGKVLPPFVRQELDLTREQEKAIADLEKEVKQKLSKILTADQQKKISTLRPRGPGGPGGPGAPGSPGGGRRGPGGPGGNDGPPPPGEGGERPGKPKGAEQEEQAAGGGEIQWFATWESGLKEAERSGRPILLVSGAPHCAGVSGCW